MEGWQKILVAAGSAAGLAAVLYYLFKEGDVEFLEDDTRREKMAGTGIDGKMTKTRADGEISLEDAKEILQEILESQNKMKANMKALAKKMAFETLSFEQIYAQVRDASPADPLEKRGLSMADLEGPISKNQNDPGIMEIMALLMGPDPSSMARTSEKAKAITTEKITEINDFMLSELQQFIKDFQGIAGKTTYDMKTVMAATQAVLDSKVTAKFNVETEDMEIAIMANQNKLVQNKAFLKTHQKIQEAMNQFMQSI